MHRPSPASPAPVVPFDGVLTLRMLGESAVERVATDGAHHRIVGHGKPLPQHEASREFLADLLWGDDSVSDPLHSPRNALRLLISKQVDGARSSKPRRPAVGSPGLS